MPGTPSSRRASFRRSSEGGRWDAPRTGSARLPPGSRFRPSIAGQRPAMRDDEQQKYHHNADEGETRAPAAESADPHHALNTPVEAIGEDADAALGAQQDEAERTEASEDAAEDERSVEDRARHE